MRFTTYSKAVPGLADAVNLQALLDQLGDFLLQSGFAGGPGDWPWWSEPGEGGERSLDALREAILRALMESGQLTPEMVKFLRGESSGDPERDRELERQVAELLDRIVQRLMEEGYLNVKEAPQVPEGYTPMFGPGGMAESAARQVQFNLTEKGMDFLGYKTLKNLLGSIGKSSMGAHETPHLATGVETDVMTIWERLREVARRADPDGDAAQPEPELADLRPGELKRSRLDIALAERELEWRPEVPIAEGLRLTYDALVREFQRA